MNKLDELSRQILALLPAGSEQLREDLHKNVHAALASALQRMDLVTREEFDVQAQVLARTRIKLEALEEIVGKMEANTRPE
jgi:BMFP domain-containing protein YqiC